VGGKYLLDDPAIVLSSLFAFWTLGSMWVLAERAAECSGWGQLEVAEIFLFPAMAFVAIVTPIFVVCFIGFAHMH